MSKAARNEALKLVANGLNGIAVTVAGAGIVLPAFSVYFDVGPQIRNGDLVWYLILESGLCTLGLHMIGQYVIGDILD